MGANDATLNITSYDMLNRYDNGSVTAHQASLTGTRKTIEFYEKQGMKLEKINSGTVKFNGKDSFHYSHGEVGLVFQAFQSS